MAKVLLFKKVAELPNVRITADSELERAMFVHYNLDIYKFVEFDDELYYFDATNLINNTSKTKSQLSSYLSSSVQNKHVSLLTTVDTNTTFYIKSQITRDDLARKTQQEIGWSRTEV